MAPKSIKMHGYCIKIIFIFMDQPAVFIPTETITNQSNPYLYKSSNLNQLIKILRSKQKYEIVQKFFNNAIITIQNPIQPIEVYYQYDMLKSYLQDINMVYFKDIEFNEIVRLEFILRRLNFTLNGQKYDFKSFLKENKFEDEVNNLFTEEYLDKLQEQQNHKHILDLRNSIMLTFLIDQMHNYSFTHEQIKTMKTHITNIYQDISYKINQRYQQETQTKTHQQFDQDHSYEFNQIQEDNVDDNENEKYFDKLFGDLTKNKRQECNIQQSSLSSNLQFLNINKGKTKEIPKEIQIINLIESSESQQLYEFKGKKQQISLSSLSFMKKQISYASNKSFSRSIPVETQPISYINIENSSQNEPISVKQQTESKVSHAFSNYNHQKFIQNQIKKLNNFNRDKKKRVKKQIPKIIQATLPEETAKIKQNIILKQNIDLSQRLMGTEKPKVRADSQGYKCQMSRQNVNFYFDDMLYQEQMDLKILEITLEIYYFQNKVQCPEVSQECTLKFQYLIEINKEYLQKLTQLKRLNMSNRQIIKKIQKNIRIQYNTGIKYIDNNRKDSQNIKMINDIHTIKRNLMVKINNLECIQTILLDIINKIKFKLIADAIEKVFEIQREDNRFSKQTSSLLFSVTFEHGLGISNAVFYEKEFLKLNDLRQESTLTAYLTPMKSNYSYISHNIYTFLKVVDNDFPYNKETNNNQQVLKRIRNKISRHKNLGKSDIKNLYYENFKLCHNCKILCHKSFIKQCRKKVKYQKINEYDEQDDGDDSLYTQKNYRRKNISPYASECYKNYCIYCIKNQFGGRLFNDKGWCPSCVETCHCNTCLRQKILKKIIDFYLSVGGDKKKIKTQKEMIEQMRYKEQLRQSEGSYSSQSGQEQKAYQSVIKREIMKGYSACQIGRELKKQKQILQLINKREQIKYEAILNSKELFRKKMMCIAGNFNFKLIDEEENNEIGLDICNTFYEQEKVKQIKEIKEEIIKVKAKKDKKKGKMKGDQRRKCKKIKKNEEVIYDFYEFQDSLQQQKDSSSFHIKHRKSREKRYQPEYNF